MPEVFRSVAQSMGRVDVPTLREGNLIMARTAKAEQSALFKMYPNAEVAQCGNCGRAFPDVFPSARCPFEYFNNHNRRG